MRAFVSSFLFAFLVISAYPQNSAPDISSALDNARTIIAQLNNGYSIAAGKSLLGGILTQGNRIEIKYLFLADIEYKIIGFAGLSAQDIDLQVVDPLREEIFFEDRNENAAPVLACKFNSTEVRSIRLLNMICSAPEMCGFIILQKNNTTVPTDNSFDEAAQNFLNFSIYQSHADHIPVNSICLWGFSVSDSLDNTEKNVNTSDQGQYHFFSAGSNGISSQLIALYQQNGYDKTDLCIPIDKRASYDSRNEVSCFLSDGYYYMLKHRIRGTGFVLTLMAPE